MTSSTCPILDKNGWFQRSTFCVWRKRYVITQISFKTLIHVYSVQSICQTRNLTSKLRKLWKLKKQVLFGPLKSRCFLKFSQFSQLLCQITLLIYWVQWIDMDSSFKWNLCYDVVFTSYPERQMLKLAFFA